MPNSEPESPMPPEIRLYPGWHSTDLDWLVEAVQESHWGGYLKYDQIVGAIEHCPVFNAVIHKNGEQVGFIRAVTDRYIFSSITEVIVEKEWQRQGIGRAMMEKMLAHAWIENTICILHTRPENIGFYRRFGFAGDGPVVQRSPIPA